MAVTLYYYGSSENLVNYKCNCDFDFALKFVKDSEYVCFDTETDVKKFITMQTLRLLQFGDLSGKTAVLVQWSHLKEDEKDIILKEICDPKHLKIGHNLKFDYRILRNHGYVMDNIWDTMLAERALTNGKFFKNSLKEYALANVLNQRYGEILDKGLQDQFSDDIITDEKLVYGAKDVIYLGKLYLDQKREAEEEDLYDQLAGPYNVNEGSLAFADMEHNGMGIDTEKWQQNISLAEPLINEGFGVLKETLFQEPFKSWLLNNDVNCKIHIPGSEKDKTVKVRGIVSKDTLLFTWKSKTGPKFILNKLFPDLQGTTMVIIKKYLQEKDPKAPYYNENGKKVNVNTSEEFKEYLEDITPADGWFALLKAIATKNSELATRIVSNCRPLMEELAKMDLAKLAGSLTINPGSKETMKTLLRLIAPDLDNMQEDTLSEYEHKHPVFKALIQYYFYKNLESKYGNKFLDDFLEPDGRVRSDYDIMKETGRVSASKPAIQQIPAGRLPSGRQNDYRNAFVPRAGYVLSLNDYGSQELAVMGTMSKDPVFLDAMKKGYDIHSVCAETMNPEAWKEGAEPGCTYYEKDANGNPKKHKCDNCKVHKQGRKNSKDINFAIPYGMSPRGFAERKNMTVEKASFMMEHYYNTFPTMRKMFDGFRLFAQDKGFTRTVSPVHRKRWFPFWDPEMSESQRARIGRQGMNTPIQGSAADITLIAMILLRRYIRDNNLWGKVELFVQVHDQIDTEVREDLAQWWHPIHTRIMEDAAEIVLHHRYLKCDGEISPVWTK